LKGLFLSRFAGWPAPGAAGCGGIAPLKLPVWRNSASSTVVVVWSQHWIAERAANARKLFVTDYFSVNVSALNAPKASGLYLRQSSMLSIPMRTAHHRADCSYT
jgi:hypothetical protein